MSQIYIAVKIILRLQIATCDFFLLKWKRYIRMTCIKTCLEFWEIFTWFKQNKSIISISSVKNWFESTRALFEPFHLMKRSENIDHSRSYGRSQSHTVLLFVKIIAKHEVRFRSSQMLYSKLVQVLMLSLRGILVKNLSTLKLPMENLLSWCIISLVKQKNLSQ